MTTLEKIKEFLVRLVRDEAFVQQFRAMVPEQAQTLLENAGYRFTQEEFETATLQLLDLRERDEWDELTEAELVGAIGGLIHQDPIYQPMYGVIIEPPTNPSLPPRSWPRRPPISRFPRKPPIQPQPMYGVIIDPLEPPIAQPMYGVVVPPTLI